MVPLDPTGSLQLCFRYTSFAMSLLLAFRLNRTYERWKEARSSVAGVVRRGPYQLETSTAHIYPPLCHS